MAKQEIISGQKSVWQLQKKTGEGDAGEIYEVASLTGARTAFLKRPVMSAFRGDIFRQSSQIRNEARIIQALNTAIESDAGMRTQVAVPRLLDQSKPGPEYNEGNFIIIEKAEGLDLGLLARAARKGLSEKEEDSLTSSAEGRALLLEIAQNGRIPETLLVDILMRLAHYLDFIHHVLSKENGKPTQGIIWNDVKPDHLFWDPAKNLLTIIDWGNARFLESDQTTVNRQFSWMDDFRQFFDEMGKYLNENAPGLLEALGWAEFTREKTYPPKRIDDIKTRLSVMLRQLTQVHQPSASEGAKPVSLLEFAVSAEDVQKIRAQIAEFGADVVGGDNGRDAHYIAAFAVKLAAEDRMEDLRSLAHWAGDLAGEDFNPWKVIELMAGIALRAGDESRQTWMEILRSAAAFDWEEALWRTAAALGEGPFPDWWSELTLYVRRMALGEEQGSVRPLEGVWRVYYTLQAQFLGKAGGEGEEDPAYARDLLKQITGEVVPNWTMLEPTPPDSRLDYRPAMQVISEALALLPEKDHGMAALFKPAAACIADVLAGWEKKDFLQAAAGLRRALMLDPDRRRVLRAEQMARESDGWLKRVEAGPGLEDDFGGWLMEVEFHASELRSQVGPAAWLERILEGCRQLQSGLWPSDLAHARPELASELTWLTDFDRRDKASGFEKGEAPIVNRGRSAARVGLKESVALIGPLDAWAPEARGSSARVVSGLLQIDSSAVTAAIKLMRMDQVQYALPLFREEALILARLADVPGVARMIECGFFKLDEGTEFPLQPGYGYPPAQGQAIRLGTDSVEEYVAELEANITAGWTPYLAVEKQEQDESLLFLCDAGQTRGRYQPTLKLLKMAVQICDVLEAAHARGIVYRDHKILHYYWNDPDNRLTMIDWNVARLHPQGLRQTDIEMDIVQFGARGLHHILTGRTAPGALPLGPTRPEEIEAAAHTYKTQWTYDDGRLSLELQAILERVLAGGYTSIPELRDDLKKTIIKKPTNNAIPAENLPVENEKG